MINFKPLNFAPLAVRREIRSVLEHFASDEPFMQSLFVLEEPINRSTKDMLEVFSLTPNFNRTALMSKSFRDNVLDCLVKSEANFRKTTQDKTETFFRTPVSMHSYIRSLFMRRKDAISKGFDFMYGFKVTPAQFCDVFLNPNFDRPPISLVTTQYGKIFHSSLRAFKNLAQDAESRSIMLQDAAKRKNVIKAYTAPIDAAELETIEELIEAGRTLSFSPDSARLFNAAKARPPLKRLADIPLFRSTDEIEQKVQMLLKSIPPEPPRPKRILFTAKA